MRNLLPRRNRREVSIETRTPIRTASNPPRFEPWDEFYSSWDWQQGEHVTLIGPTGKGKTTLGLQLLERRSNVLVLATKPEDELIDRLDGYRIERKWPPAPIFHRVVFWPKVEQPSDIVKQKEAIRLALVDVYRQGGWCLYIDELRYITEFLRLAPLVELLWLQGRSLGISVVGGTQRPAFVPLSAYDQATHLFLWRDSDEVNLRRLRGIGGGAGAEVARSVPTLDGHQTLHLNTRTGKVALTQAPPLGVRRTI